MPGSQNKAPAGNEGRIHKQNSQLKDVAERPPRQDLIESAIASTLALQTYDELRAMEVLPDEAMLLERIRRHSDTFRLLVQTARAFLVEVRG